MNQLRRSLAIVAAPFVVAGIFACGEDGQTIGAGQCPALPLYHWQYDAGSGWRRVDNEGNVVTDPNVALPKVDPMTGQPAQPTAPAYKDLPGGNGRCQTPPGYAVSAGQATGTGGANNNTGGAKSTDGGKG
jgi:hypothetical protein